jgi:hypothetical protein
MNTVNRFTNTTATRLLSVIAVTQLRRRPSVPLITDITLVAASFLALGTTVLPDFIGEYTVVIRALKVQARDRFIVHYSCNRQGARS